MPTEHFGVCPACWVADTFPVTETDKGDANLACTSCGHTFWITIHNPQEEPR